MRTYSEIMNPRRILGNVVGQYVYKCRPILFPEYL